jgi:hypothetical protein
MHRLAIAAVFVSAGALAQTTPPAAVGPDNGFFRPTPGGDPSLTHPPAPPYATLAPTPPPPTPLVVPVEVPVIAAPTDAARATERELNRAEREAIEAQARARAVPAPIPGSFTGLTNERDR